LTFVAFIGKTMGKTKLVKKSDLTRLKRDIQNELMNLEQKNQKEKKIDKLDNLLLFASSSIGYIFVLIQFIFEKIAIVLLFAPLLVFGVALPVYRGYIQGALRDSLPNRVMGWIYFSFGLGIYFWFTISCGLLILFKAQNLILLLILAIFPFVLIGSYTLASWISKKYGYEITKKHARAILGFIFFAMVYLIFSLFLFLGSSILELS